MQRLIRALWFGGKWTMFSMLVLGLLGALIYGVSQYLVPAIGQMPSIAVMVAVLLFVALACADYWQ